MFKPGEIAGIRSSGEHVVIVANLPRGRVETSAGIFKESELFVAHPSVLKTANPEENPEPPWMKAEMARALKGNREGVSYEIRDQVQNALDGARVGFNGHWSSGAHADESYIQDSMKQLYLSPKSLTLQDATELISASKEGRALESWVKIDCGSLNCVLRSCPNCGSGDFKFETNGQT